MQRAALLLSAFLLPALASGQQWRGPAALEVQVEDAKGRNLAGAEIVLVYLSPDGGGQLPSVLSDANGKANIGGLAAGRWTAEVRHAGHMSYRAELALSADGKPVVESAAHQMAPGATSTMKVRFARGRGGSLPAAARQIEPAPAPVVVAPPPAAATPAPAVKEAPVEEDPLPKPAVAPAPTPAPAPSPAAQPPAVPAKPSTPAPAPAREPAPQQPPVVAKPTAVPPSAPVLARPHLCVECPPGESAAWGEAAIEGGAATGCPADLAARMKSVALDSVAQLSSLLGPGCRVISVELPAGARFTGFRYEAQSQAVSADCLPGRACPAGGCRFPAEPVLRVAGNRTILLVGFESTATELRRGVVAGYSTYAKK